MPSSRPRSTDDADDAPTRKKSRKSGPETSNKDVVKIHPRYNDQTASFRLISSDNVAFYVDKAYIAGHSRVLNDMLKLGTGQERSNELQFSDTELEHSKVLELNLDHWHGLPLPGLRTHRHEIRLLILLAKKYDCPATTLALRATIRSLLLESSQSPVNICRSLATLEDVQGCASVNRMGGTRTWSGDSDLEAWTPLNNCVEGQSTFEVGSWSSNLFNGVPLRFTHALIRATIRATIGVKRPFKSRTDCDDVARTFTKILGPGYDDKKDKN